MMSLARPIQPDHYIGVRPFGRHAQVSTSFQLRKPAKLQFFEQAKIQLAKQGVQRFCLSAVLAKTRVDSKQFKSWFNNKRELMQAIFYDHYQQLQTVICVARTEYPPQERLTWYLDELRLFFTEANNLALTHQLAINGARLYGDEGYGPVQMFFQDRIRKSLSSLMAELMHNATAWELCRQYADELQAAATQSQSALVGYMDWLCDEIVAVTGRASSRIP
jgi:hypothetical protein